MGWRRREIIAIGAGTWISLWMTPGWLAIGGRLRLIDYSGNERTGGKVDYAGAHRFAGIDGALNQGRMTIVMPPRGQADAGFGGQGSQQRYCGESAGERLGGAECHAGLSSLRRKDRAGLARRFREWRLNVG